MYPEYCTSSFNFISHFIFKTFPWLELKTLEWVSCYFSSQVLLPRTASFSSIFQTSFIVLTVRIIYSETFSFSSSEKNSFSILPADFNSIFTTLCLSLPNTCLIYYTTKESTEGFITPTLTDGNSEACRKWSAPVKRFWSSFVGLVLQVFPHTSYSTFGNAFQLSD